MLVITEKKTRDRKRLRKKWQVSLLLKKINRWLLTVAPNVPPKSGLGKAISYALNQWPRLIRYVRHGEMEIGRVEDWRAGTIPTLYPRRIL